MNAKKPPENLLLELISSEGQPTLQEKLFKQSILGLLSSSPTFCSYLEKLFSQEMQKYFTQFNLVTQDIIKEYVSPSRDLEAYQACRL